MDTFTRNLLARYVPVSMAVLAFLSVNSGLYIHGILWFSGLTVTRLLLSTEEYATKVRDSIKEKSSLAQSAAVFADRYLLRY